MLRRAFVTLEDCGGFPERLGTMKIMSIERNVRFYGIEGSMLKKISGSEPDPFLSVASSRTAVNNDLCSNTVETLQN
jgi:hypothetical protein